MDPPSEEHTRDQRMAFYGVADDGGFDAYSRMHDAVVNQVPSQGWQGQSAAATSIPGWDHGMQPIRQHTPNATAPFGHNPFTHYSDAFTAGLPPSSSVQQPSYAWTGFNNPGYGDNTLDPSLSHVTTPSNGLALDQPQPFRNQPAFQHTIAPSALESASTAPFPTAAANGRYLSPTGRNPPEAPQTSFQIDVPPGVAEGSFLIVPQAGLASLTDSKALGQFVDVGATPQEFLRVSRSTTTPAAPRRKSRNAIKKLASSDPKLLAKLAKGKAKAKAQRSQVKAQKIPAPRLPLARAGSAVSTPSSVASSSDDDSDYDSSDDELDIIESPPYADKRPEEPIKAVAFDTVKAVWLPRRKQPTPDQIREGLRAFWEVLSTIRNRWKSDSDALKKAEEAKKNSEIPMLKDRVKSQRAMLEAALVAALEHGHPEVLRLMGENRPFLQMSYVFTADRVKDSDVNGQLSRQLLKLLVRCTTITREALDEFKLKKVLALFTKRGDEEIQKLVKQIEEVAAAASKEKADRAKPDQPAAKQETAALTKPAAPTGNPLPPPAHVAGTKRSQPANAVTGPAKRVMATAATGSKPSVPGPKGSPVAADKKAAPAAQKVTPATAAKPVNMYASLRAASKKPGTTLVEKKVAPSVQSAEKKVAPSQAAKAPTAPAWSFKDYMADLSKPKEPEKPKEKKPERGPETEEERRRRERKEARRNLRVQFKTGSALEEVRLFEHDPGEESGHDASMTRDVGDVQSEGRMFKQHVEQMDVDGEADMDIDDDDHEPTTRTDRMVEYSVPMPVDFDYIDNQQRLSNYYKSAGYKHALSRERDAQDKHESNTLLAVYLSSSDVPPNPREPADPYDGAHMDETKEFGGPPDTVAQRAIRFTSQQAAPAWPLSFPAPAPTAPSTGNSALAPDLNAILASLSGHGSAAQQPAVSAPAAPPQQSGQQGRAAPAPSGFEDLFATFQKFSQPAQDGKQQQQYQQTPPAAQPQPAASADLGSLLASLQNQQSAPQPAAPSQPAAAAFGGAPTPADWAAMMAAWAQAGVAPPALPGMPPMPGFAPPPQQPSSNGGYEHPERRRMLDGAADDDGDASKKGNWDAGGGGAKKKWNKGEKPKFILPCKFWNEGRCTKGALCTYVHE